MTEDIDFSNWKIIYPSYINSKCKRSEGRRINIEHSVENPTVAEISFACRQLQLPCVVELNKKYCKDTWTRGRVRVQLRSDSDGTLQLISEEFPNRLTLLRRLSPYITMFREGNKKAAESKQKQTSSINPSKKKKKKKH